MICEYLLASIGFEAIAEQLGKSPESIKRMLDRESNPTLKDMAALLSAIREQEGITLHVTTTPQ
jgi:DNA-binding phage protein